MIVTCKGCGSDTFHQDLDGAANKVTLRKSKKGGLEVTVLEPFDLGGEPTDNYVCTECGEEIAP